MILSSGETVRIQLNDELLMLLLRGGIVNYVIGEVQIRIEQENPLVIIKRDEYRDLKRNVNNPGILEHIFKEIGK